MNNNVFGSHPTTQKTDTSLLGGNALTTALVAMSTPNPRSTGNWLDTLTNDLFGNNVLAEANHEQYRALLTKAALDNVAALSAVESHLRNVAELGEERYKTIIDAYALSAAMRIARW